MNKTKIEWTEATWNPVTGCTKISEGCKNCYAERMAKRLAGQCGYPADESFRVTLHPDRLAKPLHWKKSHMIFVCSMGDLFHDDVPLEFIKRIVDVMARASWHTFQALTKRAARMAELAPLLDWPGNVWMGVTVEDADCVDRIDHLREVPAAMRFLSMEPLLSAVENMNLAGIDWVIVGCESGPGRRECKIEWVRDLRDQCIDVGVPLFVKQLSIGGKVSKNPAEWPEDLRIRQWPKRKDYG